MRPEETNYWDGVALERCGNGNLVDNIHKRGEVVRRILEHKPIGKRILEIGTGVGLAAAAVDLLTLGNIGYLGTDVSGEFCKFVCERWKLNMVHTDVCRLPVGDGCVDQVWAFDSLEHVRPEDRSRGWAEIARVLAPDGKVLINMPLDESAHDNEFDHQFGDRDVNDLAEAVGGIAVAHRYEIPEQNLRFNFVVISR